MEYKVGIISLGCDKNLVDTEKMLGLLNNNNFIITNSESDADIIIINTCAFIESATIESIQAIDDISQNKHTGKCKLLIVTGCMAQRYKEEIFNETPEVDAIVGTGNYHEIVNVINQALSGKKVSRLDNTNNLPEINERMQSTPHYTAYLKIAEGCDNHCTYCIIPSLRGNYISRSIEAIFQEAQNLVHNGVKELIVVAQDTTRYGIDLYNEKKLPELLNNLCNINGLEWIRLMYCYPEEIDDNLLDVIKNQSKICNYLDIPIQHSNDKILKLMGRKSNRQYMLDLIQKIRKNIPDICLRTSLMVGFPGEDETEFNDLIDFVNQIKFNRAGCFMYSAEEGTPAYKLSNQISKDTKEQRYKKLMKHQQKISLENNKKLIGKEVEVLVEGKLKSNNYIGRTYMDAPGVDGQVYFKSHTGLNSGQFVKVLITNANKYDLTGEIINEFSK